MRYSIQRELCVIVVTLSVTALSGLACGTPAHVERDRAVAERTAPPSSQDRSEVGQRGAGGSSESSGRDASESPAPADDADSKDSDSKDAKSAALEDLAAPSPYPLDKYPRRRNKGAICPDLEIVEYAGELIPYNRTIKISKPFRSRLEAFETVVRELAFEMYGRAPEKVVHRGGYRCRNIKGRSKISEHGFGNAIDVAGFNFGAVPKSARAELGEAGKAFEIRVGKHWWATDGIDAKHGLFLHELVYRLRRQRVFRIMLGPGDPAHEKLLHLDYGRSWYDRYRFPDHFIELKKGS